MADEKELAMSFTMKDIPLGGEGQKFKLDCAEAVKTGESQYGMWYLWFAYVENAPVVYDKDSKGKFTVPVKDYTGKVSFFPTEKLNNELVELCDGNVGVEVSIKKTAEEGKKGLIMRYVPEKLSDGEKPQDEMTATEHKLVQEVIGVQKSGFKVDLDSFVKASQEKTYEGKISEERAKQLYGIMQRMS